MAGRARGSYSAGIDVVFSTASNSLHQEPTMALKTEPTNVKHLPVPHYKPMAMD